MNRARRILGIPMLGVVAFGVLTAWAVMLTNEWNPVLDAELCPVGREITAEVVVLLDATDRWNPIQRRVIQQEFRSLQSSVSRFTRMHLYAVRSTVAADLEPVLRVCNPGTPDDFEEFPWVGEFGSRVVANPSDLEERWNTGYIDTLSRVLQSEATEAEAPISPIMETIRLAAIDVFGGDGNVQNRTLVVFSDLLQNSAAFSMYDDASWSAEDGVELAGIGELGTMSLDGVEVELFLLDRELVGTDEGRSRGALVELWDAFFTEQGAEVVRVRRIEG